MERSNVDAAYRALRVGDRTREGYTVPDMVEELATLPLEFSPGTRWNYSVSTDVCGHLIELISGQRLDAYLAEHVLQPLGMTDTSFVIAGDRTKRFAANYQRQRDDRLTLIDDPERSVYRTCAFFSGGGGLVSTAHDYFRFASMMLNMGELDGIRLLGRKTVELMTMNHLPDGQDLTNLALPGMFTETGYYGVGFGLGFSVMQSPARAMIAGTPGEFAWGGAAGTAFWIDPGEQMVVVFMTQIMQMGLPAPYPLRRELRTLTYASVIE
jgi:CubicO group peptidase (beta-lactamase class C family)